MHEKTIRAFVAVSSIHQYQNNNYYEIKKPKFKEITFSHPYDVFGFNAIILKFDGRKKEG